MSNRINATLKKIEIIIISLIFLFSLSSCRKIKKYSNIKSTTYSEILNQKGNKDNKYIVIIYSTTCKYCQDLEPYVINYANQINNLSRKCQNNDPKIYVLCIDKTIDNSGLKVENDDEYANFIGTTDYKNIKVSSEPALIEVTNHKVTDFISSKLTDRPFTDIKNYLNNILS